MLASKNRRILRGSSFVLAIFSALFATACGKPSISGQYVYSTDSETGLMQLVETPDKKISGQFDITRLTDKGKIETRQFQVEGATDNSIVTLTTKPNTFLDGTIGFTGRVEGNKIRFTSSGSTFLVTKKNSKEYEEAVTALEVASKTKLEEIALAKQQGERKRQTAAYIAALANMSERLRTATAAVSQHVDAVSQANSSYPKISAKMETILQEKRRETDSYRRSQKDYALSQGTYSFDQITWKVEQSDDFAKDQSSKYNTKVLTAIQSCGAAPAEMIEIKAACDDLKISAAPFKAKLDELSGLLKKAKSTYEIEGARQKTIIAEADKIEN